MESQTWGSIQGIFLCRCTDSKLIPPVLNIRTLVDSNNAGHVLVHEKIHWKKHQLNNEMSDWLPSLLGRLIRDDNRKRFKQDLKKSLKIEFEKVKTCQIKKIKKPGSRFPQDTWRRLEYTSTET